MYTSPTSACKWVVQCVVPAPLAPGGNITDKNTISPAARHPLIIFVCARPKAFCPRCVVPLPKYDYVEQSMLIDWPSRISADRTRSAVLYVGCTCAHDIGSANSEESVKFEMKTHTRLYRTQLVPALVSDAVFTTRSVCTNTQKHTHTHSHYLLQYNIQHHTRAAHKRETDSSSSTPASGQRRTVDVPKTHELEHEHLLYIRYSACAQTVRTLAQIYTPESCVFQLNGARTPRNTKQYSNSARA